jgi:hypothetical protein
MSAQYTIPVVVHVVHTGGAIGSIYNPTDAQITGAIDYLNQVYAGTYPGMNGIGDMEIQFALAKRDPNCNPTNGINRVDGSSLTGYVSGGVKASTSTGTNELNVKDLIRWNPTQYYNIWVVNKIDGADGTSGSFTAGYAYYPGAPTTLDGTVMLATQMKTGAKTLPHEIGHALFLAHPFEGGNTTVCPVNTDCTADGDGVCDTDPITQPTNLTTCRTGTNPCTNSPYSDNTEKNFMNYTGCYTLFTAGQKARVLAAMGLSSRSSLANSLGATAPGSGTIVCTPKINFEFTEDQKTETTTATSGCRSYTDYTYNMIIGSAPTATAIATISASGGTATEGVDFDITTNGSFSSPSKQLSFAAGSANAQSFTIRLYNDASVESAETITLGFSVNSGGGNAAAGEGRQNLTLTLLDNDTAPLVGTTTGTANIGTAAYSLSLPFDARQQKQRTQFLYKASELSAAGIPAGELSGISLYMQKFSTRPYNNLSIKIGTTIASYLVNGTVLTSVTPTTVKTLSSYSTTNGWNAFAFDNAFTWDGTSSIVIEVCYDNGSADAANGADAVHIYSDGGSSTQGNIITQSGVNCSEVFTSVNYYGNGYKPIIQFTYGIPGTVVQSTLNASKEEYLGPNVDVYFYDQTNNRLLARIKNTSLHDYGCTQVVIDRAGSGASAFRSNSTSEYLLDKTFHVIPTTNNTSGSYDITLYYSAAEKAGWESATGQSWNSILLLKVPSQISSYSPSVPNPDGVGAVTTIVPARSTLGTQYTLTASFTNGFSGFGAGIATTVLPVTLLSFDAKQKTNEVLLTWITSNEQNVKSFEIERSTDGYTYTVVGNLNSIGNSSSGHAYDFIDHNPQPVNYYRLSIIDLDGKITRSKIVTVKYEPSIDQLYVTNPFTTSITARLNKRANNVNLQLVDLNGRIIAKKEVHGVSELQWKLPASFPPGVYVLSPVLPGFLFIVDVLLLPHLLIGIN